MSDCWQYHTSWVRYAWSHFLSNSLSFMYMTLNVELGYRYTTLKWSLILKNPTFWWYNIFSLWLTWLFMRSGLTACNTPSGFCRDLFYNMSLLFRCDLQVLLWKSLVRPLWTQLLFLLVFEYLLELHVVGCTCNWTCIWLRIVIKLLWVCVCGL